MATLKEFEDALREQGMTVALGILAKLRERDRGTRSASPARRVAGRKMTPDLARRILELHATTPMTQQEIAFQLGINQGRVNEVVKRGKWLSEDPKAPEAQARNAAMARLKAGPKARLRVRATPAAKVAGRPEPKGPAPAPPKGQLTFL